MGKRLDWWKIIYQQPECEAEWHGRARDFMDALRRSQIRRETVLMVHGGGLLWSPNG